MMTAYVFFIFFFFNDTATTEIYTLSLHDALPISDVRDPDPRGVARPGGWRRPADAPARDRDRKSTCLNSSHSQISYAVFCLKKKKIYPTQYHRITQRLLALSIPCMLRRSASTFLI